jgi:hypothetical protein
MFRVPGFRLRQSHGETSPKRFARRRAMFVFSVPVLRSEFGVRRSVAVNGSRIPESATPEPDTSNHNAELEPGTVYLEPRTVRFFA